MGNGNLLGKMFFIFFSFLYVDQSMNPINQSIVDFYFFIDEYVQTLKLSRSILPIFHPCLRPQWEATNGWCENEQEQSSLQRSRHKKILSLQKKLNRELCMYVCMYVCRILYPYLFYLLIIKIQLHIYIHLMAILVYSLIIARSFFRSFACLFVCK